VVAIPELHQEMIGENRDVFDPLAERRKRDTDNIESIVEVLAEVLGFDRFARITIGG
jgi:hypothetical protein